MTPRFPSRSDQRREESEAARVYRHQQKLERDAQLLDEITTDTEAERHDGREIVLRIRIRPRTVITVGVAFAIGVLCGMSMEAQAMHTGIPADTGTTAFSTLDR